MSVREENAEKTVIDAAKPVRFDGFELDSARASLAKDGQPVKLAPQPFKVLERLVSRPGELVTREELQTLLWGDSQYVDVKAGLNFCIGQLRTALNDPASASRLIVAVPRRGYKFVGTIEPVT